MFRIRGKITINSVLNAVEFLLVCSFLFFTAFVRFVSNTPLTLLMCNISLVASGLCGIFLIIYDDSIAHVIYMFFLLFCWLMEMLLRREWGYSISFMMSTLSYLGIAYYLVRRKHNTDIIRGLYYLYIIYLLYRIVVLKVHHSIIMVDKTSHNYVSVTLMIFIGLIMLLDDKNNKIPRNIDIASYFVVCVLAYGRGGIVASALLLIGTFMLKMFDNKNIKEFLIKFIILSIAVACLGTTVISVVVDSGYFEKFQYAGIQSGERNNIWKLFFDTCTTSFHDFMLGGNPGIINIANKNHEGNLHNSFLQMYATMGFIFFIVNMILLISALISDFKRKKFWILLIMMTFLIRAFTDKMMFRGFCEVLYYYYLFDYMIRSSGSRKLKIQSGNEIDRSIEKYAKLSDYMIKKGSV